MMKSISFTVIFSFCTLVAISQTQQTGRSISATNFGHYNFVQTYDGSLAALNEIINPLSITQQEAIEQLKSQYLMMSGVSVDDNAIDSMLDPNQTNYDIWMDVYNSIAFEVNTNNMYVLRSVIMCIKGNL